MPQQTVFNICVGFDENNDNNGKLGLHGHSRAYDQDKRAAQDTAVLW